MMRADAPGGPQRTVRRAENSIAAPISRRRPATPASEETDRGPVTGSWFCPSATGVDGTVVPVYQPSGPIPEPTSPLATLDFGTGKVGRPKLTVSAPFGTESILALASNFQLSTRRPDQTVV